MELFSLEKVPTGIAGFDHIAFGGVPKGRTTLVSGTTGSAKTVFGCQFLAEGIRQSNECGVFVTFEESADDIRLNMRGLGWDISEWEREGKWAFVDASRHLDQEYVLGKYDLGALLARIENRLRTVQAQRVVLDSIGVILAQFNNSSEVRHELSRIIGVLRSMGVTALVTAERIADDAGITRYGIEEFVADNVIVLNNRLENEVRRRTVEILKFRGAMHAKGEHPFTVLPNKGVIVLPLSAVGLLRGGSSRRVTLGSAELDMMCDGGPFQDSIILVAGAAGTGKTAIATTFIAGDQSTQERGLYLAFEESYEQLIRNANGWGINAEARVRDGTLRIASIYPESAGLQDHLIRIQDLIDEFKPTRLVIDSLSALNRVATSRSLSEFMIGLLAFLRQRAVTTLCTATTSGLIGGNWVMEGQLSTITDSIILLRYLETNAEIRRGLTILKLRGSNHDKRIREITINKQGVTIGKAFRNVSGIMSGPMGYMSDEEAALMKEMFKVNSDPISHTSSGGD